MVQAETFDCQPGEYATASVVIYKNLSFQADFPEICYALQLLGYCSVGLRHCVSGHAMSICNTADRV